MYLVMLAVVAALTRASPRRVAGALAGGGVAGLVALGALAVGERAGWWRMAISWTPYFLTLLWVAFALSGFAFLLTWRLARRFGGRGLAVALFAAAALGPVRDYAYMRRYPEWGDYGPGAAPFVAVSVTYVLMGALGHGAMRLVAGPAREGPPA